jgi:hypothetical protein
MPICHDCGTEYSPKDETKLDGIPMGLCVACAEDELSPTYCGYDWED